VSVPTGTGEDVHKTFTTQTSGTVYAALLVRVTEASTNLAGNYFFHLGGDPIGTTFSARLFARKSLTGEVNFGISKSATAPESIVWSGNSYALHTTYLAVIKYTIVEGESND